MPKDIIQSNFTIDQRVNIIAGDYSGSEGIVQRLGAAGPVTYVHVLIDGHLTVLTFMERQLQLCLYLILDDNIEML